MTEDHPVERPQPAATPGVPATPAAGAVGASETASPALAASTAPAPSAAAVDPDEARRLARRRFFRSMAADAMRTAATLAGAAGAFRAGTQEVAGALIAAATAAGTDAPAGTAGAAQGPAFAPGGSFAAPGGSFAAADLGAAPGAVGFRSPFRLEPDRVILVDQRHLPLRVAEVECRTGADVSQCMRDGIVRGAPVLGQVAALGLALTAAGAAEARPFARRAILHGTANALANAAPSAASVRRSTDRLFARLQAIGDIDADGATVAAALRAEAEAIVSEATFAHAVLCRHGVGALPPQPADRPLRILTLDDTGPFAGGQVGTALGVALLAASDGRDVLVWVMETRPGFEGARLAAWTLGQSGVRHTVIPDAAAGTLFGHDQVDVVLAGADRLLPSGDAAACPGTYALAVLAASHEVPFLLVAPLSAWDPDSSEESIQRLVPRPNVDLLFVGGMPVAVPGTAALTPLADVVPADLVTRIVTEEGVLEPPFGESLTRAVEAAELRRRPAPDAAGSAGEAAGAASAGAADGPGSGADPGEVG